MAVMVPSTTHERTVVEILRLILERAKDVLEKLERDAVGDGSRERAYNGPSLGPVSTQVVITPVIVVPVNTPWIDREHSVRWQRAKLFEGV